MARSRETDESEVARPLADRSAPPTISSWMGRVVLPARMLFPLLPSLPGPGGLVNNVVNVILGGTVEREVRWARNSATENHLSGAPD